MSNVLDEICAKKREHVAHRKHHTPLERLRDQAAAQSTPCGFRKRIEELNRTGIALITEVKKASPSKGLIRENFDPVEIAETYQHAGAACISVLTDEPYFQGKDDYLVEIRNAVNIPLLRKDFMLDQYQIYESRALGADCILLIMAALDETQAADLHQLSKHLGMDVLIEVHNHDELERALVLNPDMIGVNNRNLKTLEVDTGTSFDLVGSIPPGVTKIAESGLSSHQIIAELKDAGYNGFLVGESLMRQENIAAAVKNLQRKFDTDRELK